MAGSDTPVEAARAAALELAERIPIPRGRITAFASVRSSLCSITFTIGALFAPASLSSLPAAMRTAWLIVVSGIGAVDERNPLQPIQPSQP